MKFKLVSDALDYVEKKLESSTGSSSIEFMGTNLVNLITKDTMTKLIDEVITKYSKSSDVTFLLEKVKEKFDEIPWQTKIKLVSVLYFSKFKHNIFTTFALLAVLTEIKDILIK